MVWYSYAAPSPLELSWTSGAEPGFNLEFIGGALYHAVLPAASFIVTSWGGFALGMRGNSIQVLGQDYIRVAKLRGLADRRILGSRSGAGVLVPARQAHSHCASVGSS